MSRKRRKNNIPDDLMPPDRFCPYCAREHKDAIPLKIILPSTGIYRTGQLYPWQNGGYACSICGLQLPRPVFDLLMEYVPMVRVKSEGGYICV